MRKLGAVIVAACLAVGPGAVLAQNKEPYRLGATLPLTGGGAQLGASGLVGIKLAVKDINDAGGVAGRPVNLTVADDRLDPTQGVSEVKRLVNEVRIEALVGALSSQISAAVLPTVNEAKIPFFSHSASNALTPQAAPYGFFSSLTPTSQAGAITALLKDVMKAKSVAYLRDDGGFSKSWEGDLRDQLGKAGIAISGVQEFALNSPDMISQILALRRTNPDALIVSANTGPDVGHVLAGLGETNWDIKVLGSGSLPAFVVPAKKIAGPDSYKNVYAAQFKTFTYCPGDAPGTSPAEVFVAKVKVAEPQNWQEISLDSSAALYSSLLLLKTAVEANGGKTDGPTVANWIESAGSGKVNVISGTPKATKDSHFLYTPDSLAMVQRLDQKRGGVLQERVGC